MHRIFVLALGLGLLGVSSVNAQTRELILPIALNGYTAPPVHYQTTLRIVNMSASMVEVTAEAYHGDGTPVRIFGLFPIAMDGTQTTFEIPAGGSIEAFTAEDVPPLNGWIRLEFEESATILASAEVSLIDGPVGPHPICTRPSTEIVTTVQSEAVVPALKSSAFAVIRSTRKSAYAIVNPSNDHSATVFLSLMDFEGNLTGSATIELPPRGRVSRFIEEFMPDAPREFMGTLRITSATPVALGGLNVLLPQLQFTGISVASPESPICVDMVAAARNPLTDECRAFPTPCDVPDGWILTGSSSCTTD